MAAADSAQHTTGYADISTGSVAHWLAVSFTLFMTEQVDMLYGRKIQAVQETARWIESFTVSWKHFIVQVCAVPAAAGISTGNCPAVDLHCQADMQQHALQIAWPCSALACKIAVSAICFAGIFGRWSTVLLHAQPELVLSGT
jgi:hypothetical protein